MNDDSTGTFGHAHRAVAQAANTAMFSLLWLALSLQALVHLLVGYCPTWRQRQRAQSTIELVIGMAVLTVLALAVWKVVGPAVTAKANSIVTDLNTSGTGVTGTG